MYIAIALKITKFRAIFGVSHQEDWLVGLYWDLVTYGCLTSVVVSLIC
jgi:hypothetical protein